MSFQEAPPTEQIEEPTGEQSGHPQQPGSMDPTKYKTKLCRNFMQKAHCNFGATCMFAHGERDLQNYGVRSDGGVRSDPTKFKTKLCKHYLSTGTCPFMDRCGFAHGQMELNLPAPGGVMQGYPPSGYEGYFSITEVPPPPQMKRAPVMELAKTRLCKHFSATGSCPYESRCLFAHGTGDLRPRDPAMPVSHVPRPMPVVQHVMPSVPVAMQHVAVQNPQAWSWSPQPFAFMPS